MRRTLTALVLLAGLCAVAAPTPASAGVDSTGTVYSTARVVVPMVFPVAGPASFTDTFLACRSGCRRRHMGQDLMGPKMTPLVAAFDGVVTSLRRETHVGGGNYVVISADRGPAAGWTAVYIHVNNDTPGTNDGRGTAQWAFPAGIAPGVRVLAGQLIAWRGNSGDAETTAPHLHFELHHGWGWAGTVFNAYPSLLAARRIPVPVGSGPHPDGSVIRVPGGATYLLQGGHRRPAAPAVLAADGLGGVGAIPVSAAEAAGYPLGATLGLRDGTVVADPAGSLWLVTAASRIPVTLPALATLGLSSPRVWRVTDRDLAGLPITASLPTTGTYSGALVRPADSGAVSWITPDGTARPVDRASLRSWGWTFADVMVLPVGTVLSAGTPLGLRDGTLVQTDSHRVGVASGGLFHRLRDSREVASYGYAGLPRLLFADAVVAGLPEAELAGG